ncbi:MAG: hypothetical protein GKR88_09250 [Flavobacteriaceae bacterium]|nr:MAG: hypothetical protein GKR88_09250 [Flavobacteriaceae bacterium]
MRTLVMGICLVVFATGFSQTQKLNTETIATVNSLTFSVDSVEELETINWKDVKEVLRKITPKQHFLLKSALLQSPI